MVERALWSLVHFWRRRDDPAILFLFFDDLFSDTSESGAIRRIADFVGAAGVVTEELVEQARKSFPWRGRFRRNVRRREREEDNRAIRRLVE